MGRPTAYRGNVCTICFALAQSGCPGLEFYEKCSDRDKAKLNKLFQWLGDHGWINNEEKFKPIEGTKFFEFKSFQIRMPCFWKGGEMVITHGFIKKTGPIPSTEIKRAERIKDEDATID